MGILEAFAAALLALASALVIRIVALCDLAGRTTRDPEALEAEEPEPDTRQAA